jgi:hypothetical protein
MMLTLELRYIAHVAMLTGNILKEPWHTNAATMQDLIDELDAYYGGFREMFIDQATGRLRLNAMIYYNKLGEVPISVINLDHPLSDKGIVTFW